MSCEPDPHKYIHFGINVYLHIFILFCFLSVFFIMYVSVLIKKAFNNQISGLVESNMKDRIRNLTDEQHANLIKIRDVMPIEGLLRKYDKPSVAVEINNEWLFNLIITMNVIFFLGLVAILYLRKSADPCLDITDLVKKNIIIFACIGLVEYGFFTKIAFKYIPVVPSHMAHAFVESIKKNL